MEKICSLGKSSCTGSSSFSITSYDKKSTITLALLGLSIMVTLNYWSNSNHLIILH